MGAGATLRRRELLEQAIRWCDVPAQSMVLGTPIDAIERIAALHADLDIPASWFLKECPAHAVQVAGYAIAENLVTNRLMLLAAGDLGLDWRAEHGPDHPAAVSHGEAVAFCEWAADQLGESIRLATEAEWELAAKGTDGRVFPWGDRFSSSLANTRESGTGQTVPVGSFPAGRSPVGLLDAAGNLDEWTSTVYAPYPGAPAEVPELEDWALSPFVTRGGGFNHTRDAARCVRRHGLYEPGPVGFRVVCSG